ncbi:TPA: hypothetical protein ACPVXD_003263 [Vibrio parahaemolyticus]
MGIQKLGLAQPTLKNGQNLTLVTLTEKEQASIAAVLGNKTKKALTFLAVAKQQGSRTNEIRTFANCSNVPQAAIDANKKLMNYGLMLVCLKPPHAAYNSAFHFWYLIEAPIMNVPISMSSNDGRY